MFTTARAPATGSGQSAASLFAGVWNIGGPIKFGGGSDDESDADREASAIVDADASSTAADADEGRGETGEPNNEKEKACRKRFAAMPFPD